MKSLGLVGMFVIVSVGCARAPVALDLRSRGGELELVVANHLARPISILEGGGLGAPRAFGTIRFEITQNRQIVTQCAFSDPSPSRVRIAPGSSIKLKFKIGLVEKLYCVRDGRYDVVAVYSVEEREYRSQRLNLEAYGASARATTR